MANIHTWSQGFTPEQRAVTGKLLENLRGRRNQSSGDPLDDFYTTASGWRVMRMPSTINPPTDIRLRFYDPTGTLLIDKPVWEKGKRVVVYQEMKSGDLTVIRTGEYLEVKVSDKTVMNLRVNMARRLADMILDLCELPSEEYQVTARLHDISEDSK